MAKRLTIAGSYQSRGDLGTGWSCAWKIACWARLFDGDHAYRLLKSALSLSTLTIVSMDNSEGESTKTCLTLILPSRLMVTSVLLPALPKCWCRVIRALFICCQLCL